MLRYKNKKATIATTITWVVATVIIIVMLIIFLVGASLLAQVKKAQVKGKNLFVSSDYTKTDRWINTKSAMAYIITSDKETVGEWEERNQINIGGYTNE